MLWSHELWDAMGKLTYHDGRLFVLGEEWISAIDAATGEEIWGEPVFMAMAGFVILRRAEVIGDLVVYVDYLDRPASELTVEEARGYDERFGEIVARSIDTGERVWAHPVRNIASYFLHVFLDSNRVLLESQMVEDAELAAFELIAIDAGSGEIVWRAEPNPFQRDLVAGNSVGLFAYAGRDYVSLDVFSQDTGGLVWSVPISRARVPFFATDDYFLLGTVDDPDKDDATFGSLFALDSATGEQMWEISLNVPHGDSRVVPVSADGQLFLFLMAGLASFDERTGEMSWTLDLPEGTTSADMKIGGSYLVLADAETSIHVVALP